MSVLRGKVQEAEAKVATYRSQSELLIGQNNLRAGHTAAVGAFHRIVPGAGQPANAEAKADSVRAALDGGASIDTLPEVISSNLIQRLRERQVQLKTEIADLFDDAAGWSSKDQGAAFAAEESGEADRF